MIQMIQMILDSEDSRSAASVALTNDVPRTLLLFETSGIMNLESSCILSPES